MFYVSSKLKHAAMWRDKQAQGWDISSSWIHGSKIEGASELSAMWVRYRKEILASAALILYVEKGEVLKGALIEVGIAMAAGLPIFIIYPEGSEADLEKQVGSWIWHKSVTRGSSMEISR